MTAPPITEMPAAPPGFGVRGSQGDAAPDSLLGQLRAGAKRKRETASTTEPLPPYAGVALRATYTALSVEEIERYYGSINERAIEAAPLTSNLDILARACRKIEGQDDDGRWYVLEDEIGPVTFDDRLARLLRWPRPAEDYTYPTVQVYEGMFNGNGFAVTAHQKQVTEALGLTEEGLALGESTSAGPTPSAPALRSE